VELEIVDSSIAVSTKVKAKYMLLTRS